MKKENVFLVAVLLAFIGILSYPTMFKTKGVNLEKLRVSSSFQELKDTELLVDIAVEQGYFKKNGVEVEKKNSNNNAVFLASGESEVAIFPVPAVLAGFYNNQDFKWLATTNNYLSSNYVLSRYPKEELAKVKNVGVMKLGNAEHAVWPSILKKLGHPNVAELKFVAAPDSKTKAALIEKNQIDIAFIQSFEEMKEMKKRGGYTILDPTEVFVEGIEMPVGIMTMEKTLSEKPKVTEGFVKAISQSIKYIEKNKEKTIDLIKSKYNLSQEDAETLYRDITGSRKNLEYTPNAEIIGSISSFVKEKAQPKSPQRSLEELLFTEFASKIK